MMFNQKRKNKRNSPLNRPLQLIGFQNMAKKINYTEEGYEDFEQ